MTLSRLLIANRGEIAIRIAASARELGWHTIAIASADDARSLHPLRADEAHSLQASGPAAYLDIDALLRVARDSGADALHPGYGFLSENPELCRRCAEAGIAFVGPGPELLALLGDKTRALSLARELCVPVLPASAGAVDAEGARAFAERLGDGGAAIILKAVDGGGGRGMRVVLDPTEIEALHARAASEAQAAFGSSAIYAERLLPNARHIEVQILGDGQGGVIALGERECTLQRNHQKLIEMAPAPGLSESLRARIVEAALRMAQHVHYRSLCTFEFLLDTDTLSSAEPTFYFIEANPRLQVEHTVTEQVLGLDLVRLQLEVAAGKSLGELGLDPAAPPRSHGHAVQLRVNMERVRKDGSPEPATGTLRAFVAPAGPGVRVDSFAYAGFAPSPRFDSLLAKLIVHSPAASFSELLRRARRALAELQIEGIETNRAFLAAVVEHPALESGDITTRFLQTHAAELHARALEIEGGRQALPIDRSDLDPRAAPGAAGGGAEAALPPGHVGVGAPVLGTVVGLSVAPGDRVRAGQELMVLSAMKMEHVVSAPSDGTLHALRVAPGDMVEAGQRVCELVVEEVQPEVVVEDLEIDLDHIRGDLQDSLDRHAFGLDEKRSEAVAKRHARGHRTARENLADLVDPGSFVEYGALAIAAQRRRRSEQDLIERTPADGLVAGVASINGALFPEARTQCVVLSYDYMVLAGTQGVRNHAKKDRMFALARESRLPLVLFAEGGGGRPGDTDHLGVSLLDCMAFVEMGRLSGLVPLVGIVNGRCFAGNAALAGCCDVLIATRDANLGMGGPAMIEGGGLGVFRPEEVGPMTVQAHNGVVDVLVEDEAEAVAVARQYMGYFQGVLREWTCSDQRRLRSVIPESRLRVYDVRRVIELLADEGSVLELRGGFAPGMLTALLRVEGRPLGVIANNPLHLSGAIDANAADKAARFMQLCDAHDLPLLFLCDTPGIMVGPEAEATGLVRHAARLFVTGASLTVPFLSIVLRKAYGLGAQAMAGGSFKVPFSMVSWPTGEFGPMGLEGAVKLGFRKELEAIEDPAAREQALEKMIAAAYQHGRALNVASHFELDDVIDPADSRRVILNALRSAPPVPSREGKKRPCIDTW